jgi:hypothetical protein
MSTIPSTPGTEDELFFKLSRAPIKILIHQHNLVGFWIGRDIARHRFAIRQKLMRANPWWKFGVNKPTIECNSSLESTKTEMATINNKLSESGWDVNSINAHIANIIYADELAMWVYQRDHIRVVYLGAANAIIYSIGVIPALAGLSAAILFSISAIVIFTTIIACIDFYPPKMFTRPVCQLPLITDV